MATARLVHNALGSAAILAAFAGIALGLPAVDRAVTAERRVPVGAPYLVGGGVTLVPPAGATVDAARTRPRQGSGVALFRLGRLQMAVQVQAFSGGLDIAAERFRTRLIRSGGYRLDADAQPLVGAAGLAGLQGAFVGHGYGGRYAVFAGGGVSIEIMVIGPPAMLAAALPILQQSLYSVAVASNR